VTQNNFKFDWGMVALLDPEYAKKYLCKNMHTTAALQEKLADLDWVDQDTVDGYGCGVVINSTVRPVVRGDNYSDEEAAIINELLIPVEQPIETVRTTPILPADDQLLSPEGVGIEDETYKQNVTNTLAQRKKQALIRKMTLLEKELLKAYTLKEEYAEQPNLPTKGYLELPPPVSVLATGSSYRFRENSIKEIQYLPNSDYMPYPIICEDYQGIIDTPDKITIYKHKHAKNRLSGGFSKITNDQGFERLIFNKKTGTIYHVRRVKVNSTTTKRKTRYKTTVNQYTLALINFVPMSGHSFFNAFFNCILTEVLKKVPDAILVLGEKHLLNIIPKTHQHIVQLKWNDNVGRALFGLIIQYKLGKRVPWLVDKGFISNLADLRKYTINDKPFITGFMKLLRKSISTKALLKGLYKKDFTSALTKLWSWEDSGLLIKQLLDVSRMDNAWYNKVKYYISVTINNNDLYYTAELTKMARYATEIVTELDIKNKHWAELYLKQVYNLNFPHGDRAGSYYNWNIFRDVMQMAEDNQMGRVRPSHIDTIEKLWTVHNYLQNIQRRNLEVTQDLAKYKFLPFALPNKEYDGFRFVQLLDVKELVDEGNTMKHCVGGYGNSCLEGNSIIVSMQKERHWVTIELNGSTYEIIQKYSIGDNVILNGKFLNIINTWHKDLLELNKAAVGAKSYKQLAPIYYEQQQGAIRQQLIKQAHASSADDDIFEAEEARCLTESVQLSE